MKRFLESILFTLALVSCGAGSNHFKIEGRFQNLRQGEFYIYSPDGGIEGMDTITIQGGEFAYEIPMDEPATFILVFPNFSEQAVFGGPGITAKIKADASHLKEMEVTGSDDNELMNQFRQQILHMSPPETIKAAAELINNNPSSLVCNYLLNKYFIQSSTPDYKKALLLLSKMIKGQPENGRLIHLKGLIENLSHSSKNSTLPSFSEKTIDNTIVSTADFRGKCGIINIWSSWNYDSQNIQRQIKQLKKQYGGRLAVLSICLDENKKTCKETMGHDSITWNTVCDELVWDGPLLNKLGVGTVPYNIIVGSDGKIIYSNLDCAELKEKIDKLLK
jgi:hypothetical protein